MPILGIYASANQLQYSTAFESIATVTVGAGGSSSITFSSIPSTYKHLQVRISTIPTSSNQSLYGTVNNDGATNYALHGLDGNGATAVANAASTQSKYSLFGYQTGGNTAYPTVAILDILDYTNTNKYKTFRTLSGSDANGSGEINLASGLWLSTNAINRLDFYWSAGNIAQYSSFALYGIKG